jgi:hypothetical protein
MVQPFEQRFPTLDWLSKVDSAFATPPIPMSAYNDTLARGTKVFSVLARCITEPGCAALTAMVRAASSVAVAVLHINPIPQSLQIPYRG